MGAWGTGNFDNDEASDWLAELEMASDLSVVTEALATVVQDPDAYIEAPDCCSALAAAEIVAALNDNPSDELPENAQTWIQDKPQPTGQAVLEAKAAVARVRSDSELRELWEETDDLGDWLQVLDDLDSRL